ncbi:MAG: response regulator transcription factor [Solirubrobacteraceae bacterium]
MRVGIGRRRPSRTDATLTPQQQRIVALAAEGLSNKEIASRLNITAKTISNHLEHIYQKLDIHTRRELIKAARDPAAPVVVETPSRDHPGERGIT